MQPQEGKMMKRGSITLIGIIVALVLTLSAGVYLASEEGYLDGLTGAVIGVQTISGECNISVKESIVNIGHDYECVGTDGFQIDADNIILDCQNHYIKCISECNNTAGIKLSGSQNITIQNCYLYNFTDGILLENSATENLLHTNYLYNNSNGIRIDNSTSNNITQNYIDQNLGCGVNISNLNNSVTYVADHNNIWNNKIWNSSGGYEACNDVDSFNFWFMERSCNASLPNIRGYSCRAGNWWLSYTGKDVSGDGLGDTGEIPYRGGSILSTVTNTNGDSYPLTDPCGEIPTVGSENLTCGETTLNSSSGEGIALTKSGITFVCNGTKLNGNQTTFASDMRGIEIIGVHDVTVIGCEVYNFTYGIYVQNSYNINLINITARDNNNSGIFIDSLSYNVTVNNSNLGWENSSIQPYGIRLRSAKPNGGNNQIISSTFRNNSLAGIYLEGSSDNNVISSNDIYYNYEGIFVNDSDGNSIYNNLIYNNTDAGLRSLSSSLADLGTITGVNANTIYNNVYGYYLESTTTDSKISGTIYGNTEGIYLYNSAVEMDDDLTIYNNTNSGILLNDSDNVGLSSTTIFGNTYGVRVINSLNLTLPNGNNQIYNNTYGFYFSSSNSSNISGLGDLIHNNTQNIVLENSYANNFDSLAIYGGEFGFNLTNANNNTIKTNTIYNFSAYNLWLNSSNDNLIYDNYIDNSTGSIDAYDDSLNYWNTTIVEAVNILGYAFLGGNYWSSYSGNDLTGDGIGDDANYSISGGSNLDLAPLTTPLISCGNISASFTLAKNINVTNSSFFNSTGVCLNLIADNLTLDFNGFILEGNNSGSGINLNSVSGINIKNAHIRNFTTGLILIYANLSNITHNYIYANNLGISLASSYNNTIYNNNFTNTLNAQVTSSANNNWNFSYDCSAFNNSILGTTCSGGNYWDDYLGKDTGSGTYPYNTTEDGIGDTNIPYVVSASGNDYLPLTTDNGTEVQTTCLTVSSSTILGNDITCLTGDGITISADDVTLDCNGKSITGGGLAAGISVAGKRNVVIKNCNVTNFYYGIKLLNSNNTQVVENNYLYNNDFYGIYLYNAFNTQITSNSIINDNDGVYAISSQNTTITNNTINLQKKFYAIYLFNSPTNIIANNTMWDNYHGVYLVNSPYTNLTNNNLSASDVYSLFIHKGTSYSYFKDNLLTTGDQAIRIKEGSNNNQFINNSLTNHLERGIYSTDSDANIFINNTFTNNTDDLYLDNSLNNVFTNNSISGSTYGLRALNANGLILNLNTINASISPSVEINSSSNLNLTNNTFQNNLELNLVPLSIIKDNLIFTDFEINASNTITIDNNNVTANLNISNSNSVNLTSNDFVNGYVIGTSDSKLDRNTFKSLHVTDFDAGIISNNDVDDYLGIALNLNNVDDSVINGNDIKNCTLAILIRGGSTTNNIYDNWLKDNTFGLNLSNSTLNTLYNNYFSNGVNQNVADDSNNTWYGTYSCSVPNIVGGPCQGGNFYSDYYGLDNGANNGEQGDGIGDQPANYTIASGNLDSWPLVLYVARQYFAPTLAIDYDAYGNVSSLLEDEAVVSNSVQTINYNSTADNNFYLEMTGLFNQTDVDASTLKLQHNTNKTGVNKTGVTGIKSDYALYLYHHGGFDAGAYLCPDIYDFDDANSSCIGKINLNSIGTNEGIVLSQSDNYYKISNLTNASAVVVLNTGVDACNSSILHDVTLTENIVCSGNGFTIAGDNLTIDFAGYSLTGNGSGVGITIINKTGVTIKNANLQNFTTAIYVDPSLNINLTGNNLTDNTYGLQLIESNNSFIIDNRLINNSVGINLTNSFNNSVYNNYFNNTINVVDNGTNYYNTTLSVQTNIIGGSNYGGNYWSDYLGWDVDVDGLGETFLPWNSSINIIAGGDYLPLTSLGEIDCGNVTINVTLGKNLNVTGTCFNFTDSSLTFDCAGFSINGSGVAFNLNSVNLTTIKNCTLGDFSTAFLLNNSFNNTIYHNTLINNSLGINLTNSNNSLIYDNYFNNTNNVVDDGLNYWNTTNQSGTNILGESLLGGNFWNNYLGNDTSGDGIGDTLVPYNNSENISNGGDYLPLLVSAVCGDGIKAASEECDTTVLSSINCSTYGYLYGSVTCSASCTLVSSACTNTSTPVSTSSSSSSGGGGGGGSSVLKITEEVNCTQSWVCGDWGECISGYQTRNCNDVNLCKTKETAGQVTDVIEKTKPIERRSCETPSQPVIEEPTPVAPTEHPTVIEQIIPESKTAQAITFSSLAFLLAVGGIYAYWSLAYAPNRLRRKLRKVSPLLTEESGEILKESYLGIYKLYLNLSNKHKQNFYTKVTKLREKIEEQLKAEKKIKEFFSTETKGDIKEQKKNYLQIYAEYQKLPAKTQEKYYHHIVQLRDRLERGK